MQYVWMIMLAMFYVIWGIYSVKDLINCIKKGYHPFASLDPQSFGFFVVSVLLVFFTSLAMWIEQQRIGG